MIGGFDDGLLQSHPYLANWNRKMFHHDKQPEGPGNEDCLFFYLMYDCGTSTLTDRMKIEI